MVCRLPSHLSLRHHHHHPHLSLIFDIMPPIDDGGNGLFGAIAGYAHDTLSAVVPAPLFAILAGFSNLIYRLVLGVSNE